MSQKGLLEIAVCDDDFGVGREIANMAITTRYCDKCPIFTTSENLLKTIKTEDKVFDIILLDIEWNGIERGIGAAREILQASPRTSIIYVTGYTQKYVQEVFLSESNLKGFLTKPVDFRLLERNIQRIYESKERNERNFFSFIQNRTRQVVYFDEIYYLESEGHKIKIFTGSEKYEFYGKLNDVITHFPDNFIRCHKSYLVNMLYIDRMQLRERFFTLKNEEKTNIPISKVSYAMVRKRFYEYKMNYFRERGKK